VQHVGDRQCALGNDVRCDDEALLLEVAVLNGEEKRGVIHDGQRSHGQVGLFEPVPVLAVLVPGWADPPQAAEAHNVANPATMMQAVLRRGNIMTLLAGRNSQKG